MSFIYVIVTICLYILFLMTKKSDKKQSIFFWGVIGILLLLGLNITVCTSLSMLHINYDLNVLTLIHGVISGILMFNINRKKEKQEYEIKKYEIAIFVFILALVIFIVLKERDFFSGAMKYGVTDSAIHYKAAKHFSNYFDLLVNIEDKTAYDFNYMQTGAYITDGICMKVIRDIFGMKEYYIYNIYETLIFLLNGFAFGCIIKDFIKDKFSLILSFVFITLYMYGFPYQAYLMGFSYLGLGLMFIVGVVATINLYYRKQEVKEDKKDKKDEKDKSDKKYEYENNFSNKLLFVMIGILSFGLIFSYSLLAPVVFASILIILFVRGILDKKKRFLKIIDYDTWIMGLILFAIALIGVMYLLIPTYKDPNIEPLGSAIANYGYVHPIVVADYIYYVPFIVLFVIYSFKKKENLEVAIFDVLAIIFTIVMIIFNKKELVSDYYLSKVYFYDWLFIFIMNIYAICNMKNINLKRVTVTFVFSFVVLIFLGMYFSKWTVKYGNIKFETAGMYYYENGSRRDFVDRRYTFTTYEIELAEYLKTIDDITVDNTLIIAKNNYHIYWVWSIADFKESKDPTNLFVNFAADYKNEKDIEEKYKYIIILEEEGTSENYEQDFEVVFQNQDAILMERK